MEPLVSIVSLTYNHEAFIKQALDGFLMQKTNFPFEIIIHDDASTDKTQDIIRIYEEKYPDVVKPIYQKENQKSKGGGIVTRTAFGAARGKYIAICEGDDYWSDTLKLQKQVDFLESNEEYVMSFHDAIVFSNTNRFTPYKFSEKFSHLTPGAIFNHEDIIKLGWFMPTASIVYRNNIFGEFPEWINNVYSGDYTLHLLISRHGLVKYHEDILCYHLKHIGGVSEDKSISMIRAKRRVYQSKAYIKEFKEVKNGKFQEMLFNSYLELANEYQAQGNILYKNYYILKALFSNTSEAFSYVKNRFSSRKKK